MANEATTTFFQEIDGERYNITLPQRRVDRVIGRVDTLIDQRKFDKAVEVIRPFITKIGQVVKPVAPVIGTVDETIARYRDEGRAVVMEKLMAHHNLSKPGAYYHVRKQGIR